MLVKILSLFTAITALVGCTTNAPDIKTLCLRDNIGNYIIKWEIYPQMQGTVKMYVSNSPDTFDLANPAVYANIDAGVATYITNDNISRKYFQLSFNDKYFQTVGGRSVIMDSVQNLRDLGGYSGADERVTRWGRVYRSGQLSSLSEWDTIRLDNLKIKTIVDLRTDEEMALAPIRYTKAQIIRVPVAVGDFTCIPERIVKGEMRKGDGILFMQDLYLQYITDYSASFAKALEPFLEPDNYPILFNCTLGKDRAGFLAAMLLAALDVPEETIIKDYALSDQYINLGQLAYLAQGLNTDAQETITVLLSSNESYMDLVFDKIKRDYGSIHKYLAKEMHLTEKKQEKIKDMMLY